MTTLTEAVRRMRRLQQLDMSKYHYTEAYKALVVVEAEVDSLLAEPAVPPDPAHIDPAPVYALLRRSLAQLGKWQRKYGEHNPQWLPPDGDVKLAEDIDAMLNQIPAAPQAEPSDEREAFEAWGKADTANVSFDRDEFDGYEDITVDLMWHAWKARALRSRAPAASGAPLSLPESMSRDEMLKYYSEYASVQSQEALRFQKRIRELEAALAEPAASGAPDGYRFRVPIENDDPAWRETFSEPKVAATYPADAIDVVPLFVAAPIGMVLHCPKCGVQHIDKPFKPVPGDGPEWTNPPHRSHLCHGCGHIWRPADVPTNGVQAISTAGKNDSPIPQPVAQGEDLKSLFRDAMDWGRSYGQRLNVPDETLDEVAQGYADRAARSNLQVGGDVPEITDSDRLAFLHGTNKDADGYEYGVARVKYNNAGKLLECLWTASDHSDIDTEIRARRAARSKREGGGIVSTPVWCGICCDNCSLASGGQWCSGDRIPRTAIKDECSRQGWTFDGTTSFCDRCSKDQERLAAAPTTSGGE